MAVDEQTWRIEIRNRTGVVDAVGDGICGDIADLGISGVPRVRFIRLYMLQGVLTASDVERVAAQLLADPVTQDYRYTHDSRLDIGPGQWGIEVWFRPGVTDAVGETTLKGVRDLGIQGITHAATGRGYILTGQITADAVDVICRRLLANDVIERYQYYGSGST
jgi:phosphoribosylformylglycinamidine synthase